LFVRYLLSACKGIEVFRENNGQNGQKFVPYQANIQKRTNQTRKGTREFGIKSSPLHPKKISELKT
jgi:hypothetical protein